MSEPLYRIKPLVWEAAKTSFTLQAKTSVAIYFIERIQGDIFRWRHALGNYNPCSSLEDGKAKCEAHYRAFIAQALEAVEQ